MKRKLLELKNTRASELAAAEAALKGGDNAAYTAKMAEVRKLNQQIQDVETLLAEKGRSFGGDPGGMGGDPAGQTPAEASASAQLKEMRKSNEYVRAWAKAVCGGMNPRRILGNEEFAPLQKALTISGGATPGEDGGFLVPLDFEETVLRLAKEYVDLSKLVNVEHVLYNSGWRAVETSAARKALTKVGEAQPLGKNDQPSFRRVNFTCATYGDRLEISRALAADSAALMAYLAEWWTPKYIQTKNELILALLGTLEFTALAGDTDAAKVKALKSLLNKGLTTAASKRATLLTNQDGYDAMDGWVDEYGRPMLVPDLSGDFDRFKARPVVYGDNDLIPDVQEGTYAPLYVGDLKAFASLFEREGIEIASTDVGGDAWANASLEVRALCRMDAQIVDGSAVKYSGFAL